MGGGIGMFRWLGIGGMFRGGRMGKIIIGGGGGVSMFPLIFFMPFNLNSKPPSLISSIPCVLTAVIHSNNTIAFQQNFVENNLEFLKLILQSKSTLPLFQRNFPTERAINKQKNIFNASMFQFFVVEK